MHPYLLFKLQADEVHLCGWTAGTAALRKHGNEISTERYFQSRTRYIDFNPPYACPLDVAFEFGEEGGLDGRFRARHFVSISCIHENELSHSPSVCFATVWRTYNVAKFALLRDNKNFTVTIIENALWSGLEINLGIINACMPVMYPALQRILNFPVAQMLSNSIWKTTTKVTRFTSTDGSGATSTSSQLKSGHIRWPPEEPPKAQQGIFCEHTVDIEREASEGVLLRSMGTTTWVTHPKSSAKSIQIS